MFSEELLGYAQSYQAMDRPIELSTMAKGFTELPDTTQDPFGIEVSANERIGAILYYVFIFVVAGVGNVLSLLVAMKIISNRRKVSDLLIFLLAINDLLCLVSTHILSFICTLYRQWIGSYFTCALQYYFAWSSLKMSYLILILMTIDRYIALVKPIYYRTVWNQKKLTIGFLICFLFSFGSTLITPLLQWKSISLVDGWYICLNSWSSDDPYDSLILLVNGSFFVLGLIFTNFCSARIARELFMTKGNRKKTSQTHVVLSGTLKITRSGNEGHNSSDQGNSGLSSPTLSPERRERRNPEARVGVVVLILTIIFSVAWSPYLATIIFQQAFQLYNQRIETMAIRIVFANTALNPLLYGLLNRTYRRGYWYFLRVGLHYMTCCLVKKPEDNNIFYVRRSWLQNREREFHRLTRRSPEHTHSRGQRVRRNGEVAMPVATVLGFVGSTVIAKGHLNMGCTSPESVNNSSGFTGDSGERTANIPLDSVL